MPAATGSLPRALGRPLRSLWHHRGFSLPSIALVAFGVAAITTTFALVHSVLLRPLPFADSARALRVFETYSYGSARGTVSAPNLADWQRESTRIERFAGLRWSSRNLSLEEKPELVRTAEVTEGYFDVLGLRPIRGRTFLPTEYSDAGASVVVVAESFWRNRLGADPNAVGGTIRVDGVPHEIVGVLPTDVLVPTPGWQPEFLEPHRISPDAPRGNHYLNVFARLGDGASLDGARRELEQIAERIAVAEPDSQTGRSVLVLPIDDAARESVRGDLLALQGAVLVAFLIALSNLSSLAMARSESRRREVAVRAALGARRGDLLLASLGEGFLLSGLGLVAGLLLTAALLGWLAARAASWLPLALVGAPTLDAPVLAVAAGVALVGGATLVLVPLVASFAADLDRPLDRLVARGGGQTLRQGVRRGLVALQIGLTFALLLVAGLLARTFLELRESAPWQGGTPALSFRLTPVSSGESHTTVAARTLRPILDRLRELPGVERAGLISHLPLQAWGLNSSYSIEGLEPPASGHEWWAELRAGSPGVLSALATPIVAGRDLSDLDEPMPGSPEDAPYAGLVNQALARRHFGDERAAVGSRMVFGASDVVDVVGVYADLRQSGLDGEPLPEVLVLDRDERNANLLAFEPVFVVRSTRPAQELVSAIRTVVHEVDPDQAVHTVRTLEEVVDRSLARRRFSLVLIAAFAGATVLLAGTGLFGLLSYLVANRRRELGVRMALGATTRRITWLILGEGLALAVVGVILGSLVERFAGAWVRSQLWGVRGLDPAAWAGAIAALLTLAAAATLTPALRAARTDPSETLRSE